MASCSRITATNCPSAHLNMGFISTPFIVCHSTSQPSLGPTSPSRRKTKSSSSSSDDETDKSGSAASGVPALKYHLHYDNSSKALNLTVVEGKVRSACFSN